MTRPYSVDVRAKAAEVYEGLRRLHRAANDEDAGVLAEALSLVAAVVDGRSGPVES